MYKQSVVTVSVGKKYYHQLTTNLIDSFLRHNQSEIRLNVLTDNPEEFLKYQKHSSIHVQQIDVKKEDKSFAAKFYMYEKAIAKENLFIDCDCLIYQDLSEIFKVFESKNFSAIGSMQSEGNFFCDISKMILKFNIESLPVFVGSVYYFKKNQIANNIFQKAIELKKNYDELGFVRLRNKENEEPLIALAMSIYNETCIENGEIKADAMFYKHLRTNVITGQNNLKILTNEAKHVYIKKNIKNVPIIHFNASFSDGWQYKLDTFRLRRNSTYGLLTSLIGNFRFRYPFQIKSKFKDFFRPLSRKTIGIRQIKKSSNRY